MTHRVLNFSRNPPGPSEMIELPIARRLVALGVHVAELEVVSAASVTPTALLEFVLGHSNITPDLLNPPFKSNGIHLIMKAWQRAQNESSAKPILDQLERNLEVLISHGANVDHLNEGGFPPLADFYPHLSFSACEVLLKNGKLISPFF